MSANVELDGVWVQFGSFTAVRDVNVTIEGGEFFSFLGPSGCGKTTLLRTISGFQEPTQGVVRIGGQDMAGIGPNKRPTALIFQNLALFPLMTVWENIAFSLEVRGVDKTARRKRADELLELIALSGQGDKKVGELSGGQKQRVAIARALAVEPEVLLLDEPLSALDLKLRQHMRTELRAIQQRVGITFIYITHDQGEALTMSDRVAVMNEGLLQQVADSTTIYDHPETAFVASFVGENNLITGTVSEIREGYALVDSPLGRLRARLSESKEAVVSSGDSAYVFVRPEAIHVLNGAGADGFDNTLQARMSQEEFEGNMRHLILDGPGGNEIRASVINAGHGIGHGLGSDVTLGFRADMAVALPKGPLAAERESEDS
jgi:spermidine/putrescine transport system ATP-binding protein